MSSTPLIAIGPRVRKSPFFDATLRDGAKSFTVYNHVYMPTGYTDPVDEYWKLVNDVTVWDVSCERQIEVTGPDAARFVQYLTPRNLSRCAVGQCRYVLLTAGDGGIINDAVLLRLAEDHFWLSPGDGDALLWAELSRSTAACGSTSRSPTSRPSSSRGRSHPRNIGFVNVPAELGAIGTELDIDTGDEIRTARVVPTPFVESRKAI